MLAKAMGANKLIGVEMNDYRIDLAKKLGLVDHVFRPGEDTLEQILNVTNGKGVERAIDASANDAGRQLAIRATREWGKSHLSEREEPAPSCRALISFTDRRPSTVPG